MKLVCASGTLYAALHQQICVVFAAVLLASLWPMAVIVVCAFIWLNLLWIRGRSR